jgi:murein DD-endopeptidase MepM/ murein hydrolase activator NlpD
MDFDFKSSRKPMTRLAGRPRPRLAERLACTLAAAVSALRAAFPALFNLGKKRPALLLLPTGAFVLLLTLVIARELIPAITEARTAPVQPTVIPPPELQRRTIEGAIRAGETMTALLGEYFDDQQLHSLIAQSRKTFPLSQICAGQPYKLCINAGEFESFEYDIDREEQLLIRREGDGFDVSRIPIAYTVKSEVVRGTITSSLFEAVSEAGETDALAMMLADIFAYDIDFIRDLRAGDAFRTLVEKRYREGKPAGYGRLLAATFTNQGETYTAFYFKDGKNPPAYYSADGKALRKAFLKAPLAFSRISSGFTLRRFHPITKTWKAHPAIDYAAPTGTPIMAIGDGSIINIGRTSGNGNFIKLRHAGGIESMYLHMSRFAKGMRQGTRVRQGQTIGYVGSTGLATGPHLCFRMFRGGAPINPGKLKTTTAAPVSRERLAEFRATVNPLLARLEGREVQQAGLAPGQGVASSR